MHPRVKKKYFNNLLILRIGDFEPLSPVEFLPEKKIVRELKQLEVVYPLPYVVRVFKIRDDAILFDHIAEINKLWQQ